MREMKIGDLAKITGWPIIAGRGGYGDRGVIEAISDLTVTLQLIDGGPRTVERIKDVQLEPKEA